MPAAAAVGQLTTEEALALKIVRKKGFLAVKALLESGDGFLVPPERKERIENSALCSPKVKILLRGESDAYDHHVQGRHDLNELVSKANCAKVVGGCMRVKHAVGMGFKRDGVEGGRTTV